MKMRYWSRGKWVVTDYGLTNMCYVILNDFPYQLEGRDY